MRNYFNGGKRLQRYIKIIKNIFADAWWHLVWWHFVHISNIVKSGFLLDETFHYSEFLKIVQFFILNLICPWTCKLILIKSVFKNHQFGEILDDLNVFKLLHQNSIFSAKFPAESKALCFIFLLFHMMTQGITKLNKEICSRYYKISSRHHWQPFHNKLACFVTAETTLQTFKALKAFLALSSHLNEHAVSLGDCSQ